MRSFFKSVLYFILSPFLIRRGPKKGVYLTFDDGPHSSNTALILEQLRKNNVKATFFMQGNQMEKHPEIVREVIKDGHTIGYHSYNHKSLKKLSLSELLEDLKSLERMRSKFDYPINLYRPPFGDLTIGSLILLIIKRIKVVMWSLDSRDSFDDLNTTLVNVSVNKINPGDIILFHDDYNLTANLMRECLPSYNDSNIRCLPL